MKLTKLLIVILILVTSTSSIKADGFNYRVIDETTSKIVGSFDDYDSAFKVYVNCLEDYQNLSLYKGEEIIETEYGFISFANEVIEYYSLSSNSYKKIDGRYVYDGAYLYRDGSDIYFKLANDFGIVDQEKVTIHVYKPSSLISIYESKNDCLYHYIMKEEGYYDCATLVADNILQDGYYYSYDGHYFYDSYYLMIDDYRTGNYDNSLNQEYVNFYQYQSFRSYSNIDVKTANNFLTENLGIDSSPTKFIDNNQDEINDIVNCSQIYGQIDNYYLAQSIYGINGTLLLAISMYETSFGKSLSSYQTNNLYMKAAFNSDSQRENLSFEYLSDSIFSFAKYYMSNKASSYPRSLYNGAFLGDKKSGFNLEYSTDPYYGEKVASIYRYIDQDRLEKNALLKVNSKKLYFYKDATFNDYYYIQKNIEDYYFILLEESDDYYKVQLDLANSDDYTYDYENNVAYLQKDIDAKVIYQNDLCNKKYKSIEYDLDEGRLYDSSNIKLQYEDNEIYPKPIKEGYEFVEIQEAKAVYKKIESIEIAKDIQRKVELNNSLDLSDGQILINYQRGYEYKDITTEMISGFDSSTIGAKTIKIRYNGFSIDYEIEVIDEKTSLKKMVNDVANELVDTFVKTQSYNQEDLDFININGELLSHEFKLIERLEAIHSSDFEPYPKQIIKDESNSFSFVGLNVFFKQFEKNESLKLYDDAYYINVSDVSSETYERMTKFCDGLSFNLDKCFKLDFQINLEEIEPSGPIVVTQTFDKEISNKAYTVYRIDGDNLIKCDTIYTNSTVSFITDKSGEYALVSKDSPNILEIGERRENYDKENTTIDTFKIVMEVLIFAIISIFGFLLIAMYNIIDKNNLRVLSNYKDSLCFEKIK